MKILKKILITLAIIFGVSYSANASNIEVVRIIGNQNAPVVVKEFSSLTCSHCKRFHKDIYPQLMKQYVETGKVKIEYHNYPLDNVAMAASMLGLSIPPQKYADYLQFAFANQMDLHQKPLPTLYKWGQIVGYNKAKVDAILKDSALMAKISNDMENTNKKYRLKGTPLIYVGNKRFEGVPDKKEFFGEIEKQLKK